MYGPGSTVLEEGKALSMCSRTHTHIHTNLVNIFSLFTLRNTEGDEKMCSKPEDLARDQLVKGYWI